MAFLLPASRLRGIAWPRMHASAITALLLGVLSVFQRKDKIPRSKLLPVYAIAAMHFWVLILTLTWIWIFPAAADVVLVVYTVLRMASYVLVPGANGECLINYAEKRLIDGGYEMGSQPADEPYINGLPRPLQFLVGVALVLLAPYMIYVVFATVSLSRSFGSQAVPEPHFAQILLAAGVALYALYQFAAFIKPKFEVLL
jgi:hypothetical protein